MPSHSCDLDTHIGSRQELAHRIWFESQLFARLGKERVATRRSNNLNPQTYDSILDFHPFRRHSL